MTYAMFTKRFPAPGTTPDEWREQEAFLSGNYFVTWVAWMGASVIGIVCSLATTRLRIVAAVVAGVVAVAAHAMPLKLNVVVAIGVAVLACLWMEGRRAPVKGRAA